jgi:hypothetical protein
MPRGQGATLGRLGGLEPAEAGRGEKALWLSGAGYRAALFHLGALTRLNELGLLAQLGTVGAVAGGSIIAALLARRVSWPLQGAYRDWPEHVAEPMRAIARRNARARALLRRPLPGTAAEAALEERYARELAASLGTGSAAAPRLVFGASGLTLSGLAAGWEECLEWELGAVAHPPGYRPELVRETIAAVRTDLDAFGEAEQAVLENHGYLVADAAVRARGLNLAGGIAARPPQPPHPRWMAEGRVREALAASSRRTPIGRLRPRRAGRARRRPEPAAAELTALLERHRPLLHYDSLESCRADSAATICGLAEPGRCNSLHRADGTLIAAAAPAEGEPRLDLDFLRALTYPSGDPVHRDDHLDECGGFHAADAAALRRRQDWADVAYGHARHDRDGGLWLQYWFFHYYLDRGWLGIEQREGDWSMLQLRLDAEGTPVEATFAQHGSAERLRWDQLEVAATEDGPAAVVYPARGSHVPRPRAGTFEAPLLPDHNDGLGPLVRPRLVPIGDDGPSWVLWPGRWGGSRRREYFEADSPRGPREHAQWWDPLELHAEAHPSEAARVAGAPSALRLRARREGGIAVVSYEFEEPDAGAGEPARIVAAPFDGSGEPSGSRPFAIDGRSGSFALQLPGGREWRGVRAAATSEHGAAGETASADFEEEERAG